MKLVGYVFGIFALLSCPLFVGASNCRAVAVSSSYSYQPVYAQPAVAYYSTYPALGVGYNPGGELVDVVKELIKDNREMRQLIVDSARGVSPLQLRAEEPHVAIARSNCASCHDATTHKGGFAMFDGTGRLRELSSQELGEVIVRLSSDDPQLTMPKGKAMAAGDRLKLVAGLVKGPPQSAQQPETAPAPGKVEALR